MKDTMRAGVGILGMEVVLPFWRQGFCPTPLPVTKKMGDTNTTTIESTAQLALSTMASRQNLETVLKQVLGGPPTDENAVKIWQLRCKQATIAALEGKSMPWCIDCLLR